MERVALGVRAGQRRRAVGVDSAEDVVVHEQPAVTESLRGLRKVADHGRVRPDLSRWEHRSQVHRRHPCRVVGLRSAPAGLSDAAARARRVAAASRSAVVCTGRRSNSSDMTSTETGAVVAVR